MMTQIKAIVLDIDGTLYSSEKKVTPKTKDILIKAQQQGIKVILASGRPTTGMIEVGKELQLDVYEGYYVSFNGSKVVDAKTREELFDYPMDLEDAKHVLHHLKQFDRARAMINHGEYMYVHDVYDNYIDINGTSMNIYQYEARGGNFKLCEVDDLETFVDFSVNKILTTGDPAYLETHYKAMSEPFKDTLSCMFTAPIYFEYTAKNIDKAAALDALFTSIGINKEEVISFGDGQNDTSIIKYAGIGVAMGNAVAELKEVADEITLSNEEDGIAVALEQHLTLS